MESKINQLQKEIEKLKQVMVFYDKIILKGADSKIEEKYVKASIEKINDIKAHINSCFFEISICRKIINKSRANKAIDSPEGEAKFVQAPRVKLKLKCFKEGEKNFYNLTKPIQVAYLKELYETNRIRYLNFDKRNNEFMSGIYREKLIRTVINGYPAREIESNMLKNINSVLFLDTKTRLLNRENNIASGTRVFESKIEGNSKSLFL